MTLPGLIILFQYGLFGVLFFAVLIQVKKDGRELFGRPSMNMATQLIGKFALFVPILVLPVAAYGFDFSWYPLNFWMIWSSVAVSFIAMIFLSLSLLQMGRFTKMGLPKNDKIKLQTKGVYSISRNPMYFGLFILAFAALLYAPNPFILICTIIGISIHHMIIQSEERFLETEFGDGWHQYKSKVRRYI